MLNLIFLKYVTADELEKVLNPFLGENAVAYTYAPANLIFLLDSHRNMRRLMDLVSLFDSDTLANQASALFEVTTGSPPIWSRSWTASSSRSRSTIRMLRSSLFAVNRINTIIAIAPNPGAFTEVEKWVKKLDVPAKITAGAVDNYVYRVKYGQAPLLAGAIMTLYGVPNAFACMGMGFGGEVEAADLAAEDSAVGGSVAVDMEEEVTAEVVLEAADSAVADTAEVASEVEGTVEADTVEADTEAVDMEVAVTAGGLQRPTCTPGCSRKRRSRARSARLHRSVRPQAARISRAPIWEMPHGLADCPPAFPESSPILWTTLC